MYSNYVYGGVFDNCSYNVAEIVDDDFVNWCNVFEECDPEYEEIKKIYEEQGLGDCSCETKICSFIESECDGVFLVRF